MVGNLALDKWNKARRMSIRGESDRAYLLIKLANHKNKQKTGQPHDMVVAMANQIKGVIK